MKHTWYTTTGLAAALLLSACQPENPYTPASGLKAMLTPQGVEVNRSWAQCNLCHPFDSLSSLHKYHLIDQNHGPNGAISCLDCHFNSMQYKDYQDADGTHYLPLLQEGTAYSDSLNVKHSYSADMDLNALSEFINSYKGYRTFPQHLGYHYPVQKTRSTNSNGTHNDGKLNLNFAPNIVDHDSLLAHNRASAWSGSDFTCAAMKCHSGYSERTLYNDDGSVRSTNTYRWKAAYTR